MQGKLAGAIRGPSDGWLAYLDSSATACDMGLCAQPSAVPNVAHRWPMKPELASPEDLSTSRAALSMESYTSMAASTLEAATLLAAPRFFCGSLPARASPVSFVLPNLHHSSIVNTAQTLRQTVCQGTGKLLDS